jgi:hypothetical protein
MRHSSNAARVDSLVLPVRAPFRFFLNGLTRSRRVDAEQPEFVVNFVRVQDDQGFAVSETDMVRFLVFANVRALRRDRSSIPLIHPAEGADAVQG